MHGGTGHELKLQRACISDRTCTRTPRATCATEVVDLGDSLIHGMHLLWVPLDARKSLAVNRITASNLA